MARILVVDDRASSRQFLVSLLKANGHVLEEAADALDGLAAARNTQPNLIISDILLPTMDGAEFVRRLRSDTATIRIPVAFSSTRYLSREAESLARSCCVFTVLTLPSEPKEVLAAIDSALSLRDRAQALSSNASQNQSAANPGDETKAMNLRQSALLQLNLALSSEYDVDRLLQNACRGARRIIGSRYCSVGVAGEDGVLRHFFASGFESQDAARPLSQTLRQGFFGRVTAQRRTVRLAGLNGDLSELGLSATHPSIDSLLCAPIASPRRAYGWLCLAEKLGADQFRQDEELLAAILAAQLGRFYENACVVGQLQHRGREPQKHEAGGGEQHRSDEKMEALARFAQGVATDFDNLVTEVMNYTRQTGPLTVAGSAQTGALSSLRDAGERSAGLTKQLLILSGKQSLRPRVFDLNTIVSDMQQLLTRLVGDRIQVTVALSSSPGLIKADPGQVEQVIMNLVVNCRDAMPRGGKLGIGIAAVELASGSAGPGGPGQYVALSISDTGCGIDDSTRAHIFEPFFTTKTGVARAGLGLATVYSIVRNAGGHIVVESVPGKGSTFRIHFPRVRGATGALWAPGESRSLPKGTETVLLVEEESFVRELAAIVLKEQGYSVIEAVDGAVAVSIAKSNPEDAIDLVIADVVMPRVGGKELEEWFRVKRPKTKVILVSAHPETETVSSPDGSGNGNFLQKPFTPSSLARKVREVLDKA